MPHILSPNILQLFICPINFIMHKYGKRGDSIPVKINHEALKLLQHYRFPTWIGFFKMVLLLQQCNKNASKVARMMVGLEIFFKIMTCSM